MILGIDVGGTTVKYGVVAPSGEIVEKEAFDTHSWDESSENFIREMCVIAKRYTDKYEITGIGIGLPGLLSVDRRSIVRLPNIPILNDTAIVEQMEKHFPNIPIGIENDAKCAALGEMYFGTIPDLDNYMLITLGTGVGSGLIINKQLFIGGRGNATEIGHIPVKTGNTLENHVGQQQIAKYCKELLQNNLFSDSILQNKELSPFVIFEAAKAGDRCAKEVFKHVGELLGEVMVGIIRTLDITNFLLGGGVSGAFEFLIPSIKQKLEYYLPNYYMNDLVIMQATMKNEAGILGAASLISAGQSQQTISA